MDRWIGERRKEGGEEEREGGRREDGGGGREDKKEGGRMRGRMGGEMIYQQILRTKIKKVLLENLVWRVY